MRRRRGRSRERGSSLIEFVLCFALFWIPFFFGMWNVGISLIRAIQVTEVCRDAGHMLAFGIDFSQASNQSMLQQIAQGLNLSAAGQSVVILSVVTFVNDADCQAAKLSNCTNTNGNGNYVVIKRIVIGNPSIRSSAFGNPPAGDMDGTGSIAPATYLTDTKCLATGFSNLMTLSPDQLAYMAEMTLRSPDLGGRTSSARSIF